MKQRAILEHGVHLEVLGHALIAQADERIKWHRQIATTMRGELEATAPKDEDIADWKHHSRRTDLETKISNHLEYARFLTFVRQNLVRTRRYRLALTDMALLELTPQRSCR